MTDETNQSDPAAPKDARPWDGTSVEPSFSEEDARLADQIYEELMSTPPLTCPISYTGPGDEETVHRAITILNMEVLLMRRRHSWLTFSALDSIVFHSDYSLALREVGERAGRPCEATSEPIGVGVAMVVHLEEKCVAVLDAGVALGIVDESDAARRDLCIDTVLHELCHVYDYGRKRRLLDHEFLKRKVAPIDAHVFTAADAAWSEYFANKYSNSFHSSPDMHPKYLAEVVPGAVNDIRGAIRRYRIHSRLDALLPECERKVRFLFQCFGYAAGRLAANGMSLEGVAPNSASALQDAGLWDVWLEVFGELERLDARREEWASFDELRGLMASADAAFKVLGMYYTESVDGMRVDIPLTPETMPNPFAKLLAQIPPGRPT